ncbi:MAG: 23S rRNA (guanosine(2251)-2'-O)-methyltransferase RlmB, partial [Clostridia bacterium]|nr:23S rRNA (guanosine(2251)-2'-O)-methyltransferase RlmB [Clostridia bacterium]
NLAEQKGEKPFIIILDEITDPHNLGSVLRTANAVGAHGVIIPKRRSAGLSSIVAKTSAGALEYTYVARVANLAQTIDMLKEKNIWFYAAHQDAKQAYNEVKYDGGIGIVIGNEGKGISRIVSEKCDFLISIPMKGEINSLNASVAAGVIMYEALKHR